jgi:TolB-like protein/Tfp pilus assembly protein PilF
MKRCPQCRRDYFDDSLSFCLDDGSALVDGPANDGPPTAILPGSSPSSEAATITQNAARPDTASESAKTKFSKLTLTAGGLVLALALAGLGYIYIGDRTSKKIDSIAVMPFEFESSDADIEYLSDGITESLINSISQVPNVTVKARSSVFSYKGKNVAPQQVAKDLSVAALLMGRVVRRADQIDMSVELVDANSGDHLWGEKYTRKFADLLTLQSEIARDVSGKLQTKLSGAEKQKIEKSFTENVDAYQLYLRGRHYWNTRRPDDIRKSIEYFQQAIEEDPTYALAYAGLADGYILFPEYNLGSAQEYYPKARAAAEKAISIDPSLAEAHTSLASILSNFEWRFADAENEFRKALELNPNYATAHQWYSEYLFSMGRYAEALEVMRKAQQLDPLSLIINGFVGVLLRENGQIDAAFVQLQKTLELDPNFPRGHLFLAETYQAAERYDEAIDEFAKGFALSGTPPDIVAAGAERVRSALRTEGPKGFFRAMAQAFEKPGRPSFPVVIAGYWARAGETDKAFAILEEGYERRDYGMLMLKTGRMKGFENDPRFKSLLRRIGLPE